MAREITMVSTRTGGQSPVVSLPRYGGRLVLADPKSGYPKTYANITQAKKIAERLGWETFHPASSRAVFIAPVWE